MKILLIGKTGQLGSELIKIPNNDEILAPEMDEFNVLNTDNMSDYIYREKPDLIINTSAYHDLHECEVNPFSAFSVNWISVRNLGIISKKISSCFIHFSTNYVFNGNKKKPYNEDDFTDPIQIYGMSKLAGEESLIKEYPENSFIIRTSVLFGGKGSPDKNGNFILNRLKEMGQNKLEIDSKQIFSITYAKDLALVIKKIIDNKIEAGIYHIVNDGECSWYELTKYIFELNRSDCKLIPVDRKGVDKKLKRPVYTVLSTEKIRSAGIKLLDWKDSVKRYLSEIRGNNS